MQLLPEQIKSLNQALLSTFNHDSLTRMLQFELGQNLDYIASNSGNLQDTVFDVIQWAEQQGRTEDLVKGAYQTNPGNPKLKEWVEMHMSDSLGTTRATLPQDAPSPPTISLEEKFASFDTQNRLVTALLKCPTIQGNETRNNIVSNLPDNVSVQIQRNSIARVDVLSIVSRLVDYPGALDNFLTILRAFEGDSVHMRHVDQLVNS